MGTCGEGSKPNIAKCQEEAAGLRMNRRYEEWTTSLNTAAENEPRTCDTSLISTEDLLLHYIRYRLENEGYNIEEFEDDTIQDLFCNVGPLTTSLPGKIIADLGNKIDGEHTNRMFLEAAIRQVPLCHREARSFYFAWLNELFKDKKLTWGRLALVIVFTGRLAQKAMEIEEVSLIPCIVEWCCQYFTINMFEEWISASGGWLMLPPVDEVHKLSVIRRMPTIKTVVCSTGAFLTALSLGYMMTK